jgi:hypothetical protein
MSEINNPKLLKRVSNIATARVSVDLGQLTQALAPAHYPGRLPQYRQVLWMQHRQKGC